MNKPVTATTHFQKIINAMSRPQKAITAAVFAFALICALAVMALALEGLSGRLDHIYNPDFCGSVVINELPKRLATGGLNFAPSLRIEPALNATTDSAFNHDQNANSGQTTNPSKSPDFRSAPGFQLVGFNGNQDLTYAHQLSFTYEELDHWLSAPIPYDNYPMSIVVDLSEQYFIGTNLLSHHYDLTPVGSGDFYVVLNRSVVNEMRQLLKDTDETFTFSVNLSPVLQFNSAELALRGVLYSLWRQFSYPAEVVVLLTCIALGAFGLLAIHLWKKRLYLPVRYDVILFEEGENGCFGRWD